MRRGPTARTVVSLLAAVLLALQFFAPTASFASAHTRSHAEAKAQPGSTPSGMALRDEIAGCRAGHPGDPTGPLRTRDRSHTADSAPSAPDRPLSRHTRPTADEPAGRGTAHHRTPRSSASHTPAALQVFRC
ncbi:hypothetical protein [Streptomyces sp. NPDC015242]|uniref:hypothetical protein n=2 Tax=unclassified Streptomyces TaxID=2593676 RepID=UPI0036FA9FA1